MSSRKSQIFKIAACIIAFPLFGYSVLSEKDLGDQGPALRYTVTVSPENPDLFVVGIVVSAPDSGTLVFRMPRWTPGSYQIEEYPENVIDFDAFDDQGRRLPSRFEKPDRWQVDNNKRPVFVEYKVEATIDSWSGPYFDSTYVLVEGPSTFMYIDGMRQLSIEVEYHVPDQWQVMSPLGDAGVANRFVAPDYDLLVDSPAQLGRMYDYSFHLQDVPFHIVFDEEPYFSPDSFVSMVKMICDYQINMFGEIPFEKYVFFYRLLPGRMSGGGLEHWNSTTIGLSSEKLRESILSAAEVTAHEFFHVWNVKRIRPRVFDYYDYSAACRTKDLWFLEGVTSYYEALTMVRSGLWSRDQFLEEMAFQIERLQETSERHQVSLAQASLTTWERGYRYPTLSFYNKGQVVGLLLDLEIRERTLNRYSLDDVFRFMNTWFAKRNVGFEPDDIERTISSLTQTDFSGFFERYIHNTDELPYARILGYAGLTFLKESRWNASIGEVVFAGDNNRVISVQRGSTAAAGGLQKGDLITHADGFKVYSLGQMYDIIHSKSVGSLLEVLVLRHGKQMALNITVGKRQDVECEIRVQDSPTRVQESILLGWIEGWTGNMRRTSF